MPEPEPASIIEAVFDAVMHVPEMFANGNLLIHDFWGMMAGGLFVAFYAKARFENPPSNRSSTTWLRYYSTLLLYVVSAITLFLFIEILLRSSPTLLVKAAALTGSGVTEADVADASTAQDAQRSTYLLAALCMTVFLPTIGPLRRMDNRLRQLFQDLAVIPHQVLMLASKLDRAAFEPHAGLASELLESGSATASGTAQPISGDLNWKWLRLQSLDRFLRDISQEPKYARFFKGFEDLRQDASGHRDSIVPAVEDCLRIASRIDLKLVQGQEPILQAVGKYVGSIESSTDRCTRRYHRLIARAVLACEPSAAARMAVLRRAGYRDVRFENANLQSFFNYVSFAFVIVIASMLLVSVIGPYFSQDDNPGSGPTQTILLAIRIALVFSVATFWGVVGLGRVADEAVADPSTLRRHWGHYTIAAVLATVSQIAINFFMTVVIQRDFIVAFEHIPRSLPWAVMVFALAFVLAVLCETRRQPGLRTRLTEAGALGVTLAVAAAVTVLLIKQDPHAFIDQAFEPMMLVMVPATSAVIGAILGFIIPESFRSDQREKARRDQVYRALRDNQ